MVVLSTIGLFLGLLSLGYLVLMMLASIRSPTLSNVQPANYFIIAIAAHQAEDVIAHTIERLLALDYPAHLYSIYIVTDQCSDNTAVLARRAGAVVHERNDGPRNGKGAALSW